MKKPFALVCFALMLLLSKNAVSGSLNKYGEPGYKTFSAQQPYEAPIQQSQDFLGDLKDVLARMPEIERNKMLDQYQFKFKDALKQNDLETAKKYLEIIGEWR
ncbi:MAG: hypothetical protein COB51_11250 [Moraxellaceae bacterium]|nr:MAG: hypothetical protein COB51_11250 [Moraxellaceae bacterium]